MARSFNVRRTVPTVLTGVTVAAAAGPAAAQYGHPVPVVPCPPAGVPVVPLYPTPGYPGSVVRPGVPATPGYPTAPGYPATPPAPMPGPSVPGRPGVPPVPVVPGQPSTQTPSQPPAPQQPGQPTAPQQPVNQPPAEAPQAAPAADAGFSQASQRGSDVASSAPSMMGDLLGARSVRIGFTRQLQLGFQVLPAANGNVRVNFNDPQSQNTVRLDRGVLTADPNNPNAGPELSINSDQLDAIRRRLANVAFNQPIANNNAPLTLDQTRIARTIIQAAVSQRPLTAAEVASLPADIQRQLPQIQAAINQQVTQVQSQATRNLAPGVNVANVQVGPVTGGLNGNVLTYTALLTGGVNVPLPGSSSTVGRVKMSEDNNPLPRDRFIFNYDSFSNVPFTTDGINVNRFQFGVEKTFRGGRDSFEFRIPFAGTLNSTNVQGAEGTATELGNIRFAYKHLWTQGQRVNFASGLGVTLPTADDQIVNLPDGTNLYTFKNESVQLEPFVALLFTPNDRLFGQVWSSVNFDANGGLLTYNTNIFDGSGRQRIIDLPYLAVDGQIGYWLFRSQYSTIRGVAPFLELHWNYAIAQNELLRSVNRRVANTTGLTISGVADQELNLTAGVTTQIGANTTLTLGGTAPLFDRPDRTFDGQFGLRLNYFFGRTARERSAANYISSY